ncbi:hypothetical protein GCM10010191_47720 [Actinomadura vinacea]|uniref:Sensor domain-containing protein n=1 Tax=Actinomadura vinacea TaxID=115336 RepID=A0ABN3JHJ2_9ACTN
MAHRLLSTAMLLTVTATAAVACGGDGDDRTKQVNANGRARLAGTFYTSDQLEQALLTEPVGYRRSGDTDSGEYGGLKSIQNFNQLQRQVTLDKPKCSNAGGARPGSPPMDESAPTAIASFVKDNGQNVTETLMALPADTAAKHVNARVPAGCVTFRTKVGDQWAEHRVFEAPPGTIGEGSRTVGVTTVSGQSHVKTWYVVLRGRRYLATISLIGAAATRAEAEQLARQADAQANRVLP